VIIKHVVSDHSTEGNLSDKYLPVQTFLLVSFEHILINLTCFMGIPYLVRILYGIFIEVLKLHFSFKPVVRAYIILQRLVSSF
jgi:hypothetical protein